MKQLTFLLLWLVAFPIFCQEKENFETIFESLFQVQNDDLPYEQLYEIWGNYYQNPINLNRATPDQLAQLHILRPIQIQSFFDYTAQFGDLISIYELQSIPNFDSMTIQNLRPFVTISEKKDARPFRERFKDANTHYLLLRNQLQLQKALGYQRTDESHYLGTPNQLYMRYKISTSQDFSFGITAENDAGEQLKSTNDQAFFDFVSFHGSVMNKGKIKNLTVGDFVLQSGQGMVFGAGFGFGKGGETITTIKRNHIGIIPYTSSLETGFFRGVATQLSLGKLESITFLSSLKQDANVAIDSLLDYERYTTGLQSSGLHRSAREQSYRNAVRENNIGQNLSYRFGHQGIIGANLLLTVFDSYIQKAPNDYNQFEFEGTSNLLTGLFGNYIWKDIHFFGEFARSSSGGKGYLLGAVTSLSQQLDFSLLHRHYDREFHSFYGNGFGEQSRNINEKGTYLGLKYFINRKNTLAGFIDIFRFDWLKYRTSAPSDGFEWLIRHEFSPSKSTRLTLQYKQEQKQRTANHLNIKELEDHLQHNYAVALQYPINQWIIAKTRIQGGIHQTSDTTTSGLLLLQDINIKFRNFGINLRYAVFDTDFENRQYAYENDVKNAYSIPAYQGNGTRSYVVLKYTINHTWSIWFKYAQSYFPEEKNVGSGNDMTQGSYRSLIKMLLQIKL